MAREVLDFRASNGVASRCEYEIRDMGFGKIVFLIQGNENRGSSVTNSVEIIASLVKKHHHLPVNTVFIEYYPPDYFASLKGDFPDAPGLEFGTFDMVFFGGFERDQYLRPTWKRVPYSKKSLIRKLANYAGY